MVSTSAELLEHCEVLVLTRDDNDLFELAAAHPSPPFVIDLTGAGRTLGEHRLQSLHASDAEQIYPEFAGASDLGSGASVA
jgi:hypothetical protein